MIKLTSFYPFENFLRVTQEFYDNKIVVKRKSLDSESEFEFQYEDLGEISDIYYMSNSQYNFSFFLLAFTAATLTLACNFIYSHPLLHRIFQAIYVFSILLYATSFIRSWHIIFSDKKDNVITRIQQTRRNRDLISKVIEVIKSRSKDIQEISVTNPFPETKHVFEHNEFDLANLRKTTERFYEDQILGIQKSTSGDYVYSIKYNQLNGRVQKGKIGINVWGAVFTSFVLIISIISGFSYAFQIFFGMVFVYIIYVLLGILAVSFMLRFIKREVVGLESTSGSISHWVWVNKSNKEKIEEIIKYIQSRVPVENNETSSKE